MSAAPPAEIRNARGERLDFAFHPAATRARREASSGSTRPAVVIAHGVTSNKDRPYLIELADAAARAGIAALRFSFAGNGASEGSFQAATLTQEAGDLASVLDALTRGGFAPIAVAGHSMGGAVALLAAAQEGGRTPARVRALVSLAGMFHVARFFERHFAPLPFGAPMRGLAECPWNEALAADAARLGSLHASAASVASRALPWLLVHGDADDMVPIEDAFAAQAAADARRPELVTLRGVDHRFTGAIPALVAAVVPWLQRELGG